VGSIFVFIERLSLPKGLVEARSFPRVTEPIVPRTPQTTTAHAAALEAPPAAARAAAPAAAGQCLPP